MSTISSINLIGLQSTILKIASRLVAKTSKKQPEYDFSKFEASIQELEKIVERMENGEQTLEQSLEDFERGVTLSKTCQDILKNAEQRVEILIKEHGELKTESFDEEDSE